MIDCTSIEIFIFNGPELKLLNQNSSRNISFINCNRAKLQMQAVALEIKQVYHINIVSSIN